MKRILACFLACTMISGFSFIVTAEDTAWKEFYVSENGNDTNPGTKEAPFKTVQAAKDAVRNVNKDMQGDIVVNIEEGYYYLENTLDFSNEDSASNGYKIIYRGIGDKKPVLSGGRPVTGFRETQYENIWEADYDTDILLQLMVGGKKRYVAKSAQLVSGVMLHDKYLADEYFAAHPEVDKHRKYDWNDLSTPAKYDGFFISKRDFGMYENAEDVLLLWERCFITNIIPVEQVKQDPDRPDNLLVIPNIMWNSQRTSNGISNPNPEAPFTVMNAFELLDEPGEFYYNRKTKKLYYMPEEGEIMNETPVIAPELETLVMIDGNDVDDKIKNLAFENLQFSDTKMDYLDGFSTGQATDISGSGFMDGVPRTFFAMRIDGLDITDNIFCNLANAAIGISNGVENFNIIGNAIYDVGENGIAIGERNHGDFALGSATPEKRANDKVLGAPPLFDTDGVSDPVPEDKKDALVNLMMDPNVRLYYSQRTMGGITTSDPEAINYPGYAHPDDADDRAYNRGYDKIHVTYLKDEYTKYDTVWRDTHSKTKGEKPFVMIEFLRPYNLEQVTINFNLGQINEGENADYEVLVSNDKSFAEGTYKVIGTQNGAAPSDVNHYPVDDEEKYQYIMIRKLYPGDLALSRVWATTYDRKPWVKNQRCKNFVIKNNIVERTGTEVGRSIGIVVLHGENGTILHNDVRDASYTGISVGYSWNNWRPTCYNMQVGYNYVYDSAQTGHDGGGIYVLGPQPNSRYFNNHIERTNLGINMFYTDNGTRYETIENNYMENGQYILSPYTAGDGGIWDNTYRNNFGLHLTSNDRNKANNDYEEPKQEVIGQPSRGAYDTYANAGLEPEYGFLRDVVPVRHDNLFYRYDYYKKADAMERATWTTTNFDAKKTEITYTLNNAKFGDGLGMYPAEYKQKLSDMSEYLGGSSNSDIAMRITLASEFEEELKASMERYSLADTIKICEELLSDAKGEGAVNYPAAAVNAFENSLLEAKAMPQITGVQQYDKLIALETAYNNIIAEKYSDLITGVTVEDAVSTVIDEEKSIVTVYMPKDASLKTENIDITTEGNSSVSRTFSGVQNLEQGISVPVYHKGTKKYRVWTIKAEHEVTDSNPVINKDTGWIVNTRETELIRYGVNNVTLPGGKYAYMAASHGGDAQTKISFNPLTNHDLGQFNIILGANTPEEFDYGHSGADYNRCEVEFNGSEANFYKVAGGKRTLIDTAHSGIKWNEKNDLTYQIKEINQNTHITVRLNGKMIFSEVIQKCSYGRTFGFYTPYMNIRVY